MGIGGHYVFGRTSGHGRVRASLKLRPLSATTGISIAVLYLHIDLGTRKLMEQLISKITEDLLRSALKTILLNGRGLETFRNVTIKI